MKKTAKQIAENQKAGIGKKKFKIPKNIRNQEIGGVIIGYWTGISYPAYKMRKLITLRNVAPRKRRNTEYSMPRLWGSIKIFFILIWINAICRYRKLPERYQVIGLWHSHPNEKAVPGKKDDLQMMKILEKQEKVLLGIMKEHKMNIFTYDRKRIYKRTAENEIAKVKEFSKTKSGELRESETEKLLEENGKDNK